MHGIEAILVAEICDMHINFFTFPLVARGRDRLCPGPCPSSAYTRPPVATRNFVRVKMPQIALCPPLIFYRGLRCRRPPSLYRSADEMEAHSLSARPTFNYAGHKSAVE